MRVKTVAFLVIFLSAQTLRAQYNPDVINYINTYKDLAIGEMQRSGIPASLTLAQGIHETEAGTSDLVRRSNNHFGIKCKDNWTGSVVYHDDDSKGECFRSYATPLDSYKDHSDFLRNSQRYAFLFRIDPTDFEGWAYGLKKAGYATNIRYSQILIKLIKDYNLQQYTFIAMGKIKPSDEVVLTVPGATSPATGGSPAYSGTNGNNNPGGSSPSGSSPSSASASSFRADQFPTGEFLINRTRVVFVKSGVSMLSVADQFGIPLARLLEFNDLEQEDVLSRDQLLFLQRKRKTGPTAFHIVMEGETLYDISQREGVRYDNLLEMNHLSKGLEPAPRETIYLQGFAPSRPLLATNRPAADTLAPGSATTRDGITGNSPNTNTGNFVPGAGPNANPGTPTADTPGPGNNMGSSVPGTVDSTGDTGQQPAQLPPGSAIRHIVQSKETLYGISKKYGVDAGQIRLWNKLDSADLKIGQELIIYKN